MKANLTGIPETLFVTLRARAQETARTDAAINDPYAVAILKQLEFEESPKNKVSRASQAGIIIRTVIFDEITHDYVSKNPKGIIVNLGCGLDARCKRLSLKGCRWFDIDVEESIRVRQHFFNESPSYKMIAKSMFDYTWMDAIPKDQPVLMLAEGVVMFFPEKDVKALFCQIAEQFPAAEIAFDTVSEWAMRNTQRHPDIKKYDAPMKWGINDIKPLESWHAGFRIVKEYFYASYLRKRWPWPMQLMFAVHPSIGKLFRVVRLQLSKEGKRF